MAACSSPTIRLPDPTDFPLHVGSSRSGHFSGTYLHLYFYYEDKGDDSPVFVRKVESGSPYFESGMQNVRYGSYGWGLATYVDSFDEFMEFIDEQNGRADNGLNNTSMYDMYRRWEEIFNEAGGIPNGYYCDGVAEFRGYKCRIWSNGYFYYYVNEDNACLQFGGLGTNRDFEWIEKIEEITEIPYGPIDIDRVTYTTIDIKYGEGSDSSFADQSYFQIENINDEVSISEYKYLSNRIKVVGWEVLMPDGSWKKIEGLSKIDNVWCYSKDDEQRSYKRILDEYFDGKLAEIFIRAITVDAEMPVKVTVKNGYIYSGSTNYGSEEVFPAGDEITLTPDSGVAKWIVTVNGVTTEYEDYYNLQLTLPESGTVVAECVLPQGGAFESDIDVTINVVGSGKVNKESGKYPIGSELELIASPKPGKVFVGWYVVGLYNWGGDMPTALSLKESESGEGESAADYSELYGELFSTNYHCVFMIDPYDDVVITAVFEDYVTPADYFDVIIKNGFVLGYDWDALQVTALRLKESDYICIFKRDENDRVIGWTLVEDKDGVPTTTEIEGEWGDFYAEYNTEITPIFEA